MTSLIPPLFAAQEESVAFEESHERVVDASDPGTGKTRARLEAFSRRRAHGGGRALVLCPKSVMYSAWAADCRRYTPWLTFSLAYATNRADAFFKDADIYVANHDATKWLAEQPHGLFQGFDTLYPDEGSAYKHYTSGRSKALAKIKRFFGRRVLMNGSLTTNGVTDAWHQVHVVDDGQRLGKSFYAFRNAVCVPKQVGQAANMLRWEDKPDAEKVVADLIRDITIRHELQDVPENEKYVVPFLMSVAQQARYDEMEAAAIAKMADGTLVEGVNAAAVVTKLLQIASGAVYDGEGNYHVVDPSRYELVADVAAQRRHVVVFFNWQHQRDLLAEEFKKRGLTYVVIDGGTSDVKRREIVEQFQMGMYRVLLAHPQTSAHGLTLTKGTRTIWASPTYNLDHWIQGNARIHRAGQKEVTETVNVLAENTIEEHVYAVMKQKRGKLSDLLEYLR